MHIRSLHDRSSVSLPWPEPTPTIGFAARHLFESMAWHEAECWIRYLAGGCGPSAPRLAYSRCSWGILMTRRSPKLLVSASCTWQEMS